MEGVYNNPTGADIKSYIENHDSIAPGLARDLFYDIAADTAKVTHLTMTQITIETNPGTSSELMFHLSRDYNVSFTVHPIYKHGCQCKIIIDLPTMGFNTAEDHYI